ncbi:MAG TPA: DUF364 domain-containing protein [Anaerolineae bacterium]|nr:DUF364 domain-containing protein [Anaerolineae bacterium]
MTDILAYLRVSLLRRSACALDDEFVIRGVWDFTMRSQPNSTERTFAESGCVVATYGLGASFRAGSQSVRIPDSLMARDGRQVVVGDRALQVAILDACYAVLPQNPNEEHILEGDTVSKSSQRAGIVCDEVKLIATSLAIGKPSVLMIGVVHTIAEELRKESMTPVLSDLDPRIVGSTVAAAEVHHGGLNRCLIRACDIVLATGMTITTATIDEIVAAAAEYAKPLVVFAQTGSNFADEYLALGIDTVVAERYPWYSLPGQSVIKVFRRS